MAITNLACRECGTEYALTAQYVCSTCFGPLEARYDHSALAGAPAQTRRRIGDSEVLRRFRLRPAEDPVLVVRLAAELSLTAQIADNEDAARTQQGDVGLSDMSVLIHNGVV